MFSLKVIDTDLFLEMPQSTRLLYYELCMRADDDGFVASPKKIMKMTGCSDDDYRILMAKQYIIPFESGICVIKHWRIHNLIQKDRYQETEYKLEKSMLELDNNKYEICTQNVSIMEPQVRLGKVRLGKDRLEYIVPYLEIVDYLNLKANTKYKSTSSKTKDLIKTRFNEKFTLEDFKKVIEIKAAEWIGSDMEKFLRPETLFGPKFEGYLNQGGGKGGTNAKQDKGEGKETEYDFSSLRV